MSNLFRFFLITEEFGQKSEDFNSSYENRTRDVGLEHGGFSTSIGQDRSFNCNKIILKKNTSPFRKSVQQNVDFVFIKIADFLSPWGS